MTTAISPNEARAPRLEPKQKRTIGLALLAISLGIGAVTLYKGAFSDEADNLVVGSLLLRGYVLYRDIFSHHFPFAYYWSAFITALVGKSIIILRLSLLVFQVGVFALAMRLTREYLILGLAAFLWGLFRSFYRGNMILYNAFAAPALVFVFISVVTIIQQRPSFRPWHYLSLGLFCLIAFLADPLSIYAILVALLFITYQCPRLGLQTALVLGGGIGLYFGYLLLSNSLGSFWENAIYFNAEVYGRYLHTNPMRLREWLNMVIKGLEIADKGWWQLDPLKPIVTGAELDRWLFTGGLYRCAILVATLFLTFSKKFRAAAFLYLYAASTLVISKGDFRGQPFIMLSLTAVAALALGEWWPDLGRVALNRTKFALSAIVLALTLWTCLRFAGDILHNARSFGPTQFAEFVEEAARIQELTCHQPHVSLGRYPGGIYPYWFTDMEPVSKYVFMWPWVADVGLDDVIEELAQEGTLAIVIREERLIWGQYDTKVYLRPLDEFLRANYQQVEEGVYLSPALHLACSQ